MHRLRVGVQTCDPRTLEREVAVSGDQVHPWLHMGFKANLDYIRDPISENKQKLYVHIFIFAKTVQILSSALASV